MDHSEALELIETAAAEPDGLDRLMAGDTAAAAALAGHLAACSRCRQELVAVRHAAAVVRDTVRSLPDPGLRERTLAYVRAMGRPSALALGNPSVPGPETTTVRTSGVPLSRDRSRIAVPLAWAASLAATLLLGAMLGVAIMRPPPAATPDAASALAEVAVATLRVEAEPDARRVALTSTDGAATAGTLVFSPSTGELVVVATELAEPGAGSEYGCWVETEQGRRRMGKMFFGGGIAYWVGPVEDLELVRTGDRFGVSLVPLDAAGEGGEPVLVGEL